jgi:hypothetical protein
MTEEELKRMTVEEIKQKLAEFMAQSLKAKDEREFALVKKEIAAVNKEIKRRYGK